jgi:glycosyltransferase involved in cell wall biosynthesis
VSKEALIAEINNYINLCRKGLLIRRIKNSSSLPKISVVIPVYNSEKTITYCIRSVQNQKMSDIEIILVDDYSNDNSTNLIRKFQKNDKRIKLIRNKKNRGTLYSRSVGVLNSRGKYIMHLDNDDLFINDILLKSYEEAEISNVEIIEFSGIAIHQNSFANPKHIMVPKFLTQKKDGIIIRQPELSQFMYYKFNNTYQIKDAYIWGKIIKTKIYKKALVLISNDIYNHNVCWVEDQILTFGLFRIAKSFKFINIYGIIYIINYNSVSHTWAKEKVKKVYHDKFILLLCIFNLSKNSEDVEIAVNKAKLIFNGISKNLDKMHKNLFINLYERMLNCSFISNKDKKKLTNLFEQNKNFLFKN